MEIIDHYRRKSLSDGYRIENCWFHLPKQKFETQEFLIRSQRHTRPSESRILVSDLVKAIDVYAEASSYENEAGLFPKIVVQKSNTAVNFKSKKTGLWAHLAFLYGRVCSGPIEWYLYAYARGRFKPGSLSQEIRSGRGIRLAYASFLAINEQKNMRFKELN
ncbi:hypothetical protein [Alloalcanivorax marinus]|uniref:hypothetical protein n=1 Tax=Alloalcanivorax marinus TaxID=1177169 RepID=UPI0019578D33|nr:hypothetical protein [Alloalcanivorax marinus]MBM7335225.1 hypothetical protein [Alloalcanivorax marinus]